MNQESKLRKHLEMADTRQVNSIIPQTGNSLAHELVKFATLYRLKKKRHSCYSEPRSENHHVKYDLVDLTDGVAYEFETNASLLTINRKVEQHADSPFVLEIVDVQKVAKELIEELEDWLKK